jgi:hypothetical protein
VGPQDNSSGDWGCWADLRMESLVPVLVTTIHDQQVSLAREPGPFPATDLTLESVRGARKAVLHFQGIGLEHGGQYVSQASLNGVPLGDLPAAGGRETEGIWSDAELVLSAAAIASLQEWNELTLRNPGEDSFKVRNFWIEAELADGRQVSSQVTRSVFTQPGTWPYAEGVGVPFDQEIRTVIRLPVKGSGP